MPVLYLLEVQVMIDTPEDGTWVAVILDSGVHAVGIVIEAKRGTGVKFMTEKTWAGFVLIEELTALAVIDIDWDVAS